MPKIIDLSTSYSPTKTKSIRKDVCFLPEDMPMDIPEIDGIHVIIDGKRILFTEHLPSLCRVINFLMRHRPWPARYPQLDTKKAIIKKIQRTTFDEYIIKCTMEPYRNWQDAYVSLNKFSVSFRLYHRGKKDRRVSISRPEYPGDAWVRADPEKALKEAWHYRPLTRWQIEALMRWALIEDGNNFYKGLAIYNDIFPKDDHMIEQGWNVVPVMIDDRHGHPKANYVYYNIELDRIKIRMSKTRKDRQLSTNVLSEALAEAEPLMKKKTNAPAFISNLIASYGEDMVHQAIQFLLSNIWRDSIRKPKSTPMSIVSIDEPILKRNSRQWREYVKLDIAGVENAIFMVFDRGAKNFWFATAKHYQISDVLKNIYLRHASRRPIATVDEMITCAHNMVDNHDVDKLILPHGSRIIRHKMPIDKHRDFHQKSFSHWQPHNDLGSMIRLLDVTWQRPGDMGSFDSALVYSIKGNMFRMFDQNTGKMISWQRKLDDVLISKGK